VEPLSVETETLDKLDKGGFIFLDNSRLSEFKKCPRAFFFSYLRHFKPAKVQLPLDFGTSWHAAMDEFYHLYYEKEVRGPDLAAKAMEAFNAKWAELGHPLVIPLNMKEEYGFRNPGTAREMLFGYLDHWAAFLSQHELVAIEQPFAIPIDPDNGRLFYVGRIDKILRRKSNGLVIGVEHKTSSMYSKEYGFQYKVTEKFSIDSQVEGYSIFLRHKYPKQFEGVYVDLALLHANRFDVFTHVPVIRSGALTDQFIEDSLFYIDSLLRCNEDGFFPKNAPGGCETPYGFCDYHPICKFAADPMNIEEPPDKFKRAPWEPFSFDELKSIISSDESLVLVNEEDSSSIEE